MKKELLRFVCAAFLAMLSMSAQGQGDKIVVVSDIHVMSPWLLPDGAETQEAWTTYYANDRKMLQQSAAIFDQFVLDMISLHPTAVFITGDLTKDGERYSHTYVRGQLSNLDSYGIKVFVIPGNHDFGEAGIPTQFNADGTTSPAEVLTTGEFADWYQEYGYEGSEKDPNSLSYVAEPMDGIALLAIDSHTASISNATLEWLCTKATEKRNAGKQVIAMMHHPLFPHITGADMFIETYNINNYEDVRNALINAGVNVILTGHFHTSDIAKDWDDDEDKAVYDINTGSLISYPCDYRILTPSADRKTLNVQTASIVPTGMTADECKTWLQGRIKSVAVNKMNAKAGAMASMAATQINNIAEFAANLFILHAEGDENKSADRADLETTYTTYKNDYVYNMALSYGGIEDNSIYSILDDVSNYGDQQKANQIPDRTLVIPLPEVIKPSNDLVTIGTDQTSTNQLPTNQYYNYGLSQQIYTSSEIGHAAGYISSIAFNTVNGPSTRNLTIYMTHTAKNAFDNNKDFVAVTDDDIVFSGNVTFEAGQWNTIDLDSPFSYDGTSNILLTVDDNTGSYASSDGLTHYVFDASAQAVCVYYDGSNLDPNALSYPNYITPKLYDSKNQIQIGFDTYLKPSKAKVSDIGDVSARVSCTLLGATAWNLRYRKVAGDGEEEQEWTTQNNLTDPSFLITGLTAMTTYEAQLQAVYPDDNLSSWSRSLVFTTNCCPVEEQAEIIYSMNSNYSNYFGYAVQFIDITDEKNPVEVAYINPPSYGLYGGTLTLCCGHKYQVNWIYDSEHSNVNGSFSLSLYYEPGDLFYSMAQGEAPTSTSELTTFIMDCTPYCVQMPQIVNEAGTTYDSATLTFASQTKTGQVVYSTEADFDPETATPEDMDFEELPKSDNPWGGVTPNVSATLKGLQPLTAYYVSVRSVCTVEPIGTSRWTKPVKVITGSRYDGPTQPIAKPISSSSEGISWGGRGNETGYKLYYRAQAAGSPVDASAIKTFGGGKGSGFGKDNWGDGIYDSSGDRPFSNTLFVTGVPAGSSFGFKAGNGKTGAGMVKFLYGMRKFVGPLTEEETMKQFDQQCLNDADRQARIDDLNVKLAQLEVQLMNGEISREEYDQQKADIDAAIAFLNSLPTDDQKLDQMRTLEQKIKDNNVAKAELTLKFVNGEITKEQYESEIAILTAQNVLNGAELSELRAITTNAEDPNKDGFAISREDQSSANAPRRAPGDETYIFFIRHSDPNGVLLVKDLTITPPEKVGAWTVIDGIKGTEYTLTGLEPGTAYEVMVEPVYEDGTTGSRSAITVFTTLGSETDPTKSTFSVSQGKKVQFAKGNLRYSGDSYGYEYEWSMAKQQYEILGEKNIRTSGSNTYPANPHDLFCWSTTKNYCGVYNYYDDDPDAYFKGDFVDWGTDAKLASDLGSGWSTLTKDEWSYLLTERDDAATKKATATIALDAESNVKGLLLLPDEWTAPAETPAIDGSPVALTLAQWTALETAGAVFLPAAGQMTSTYDNGSWTTTTNLTEAGSYWTATPSDDASGLKSMTLSFDDATATLDNDLNRRVMIAVRLVKAVGATVKGDANGDGVVDIADAVAIMNYILGNPPAGFNEAAADISGDGNITITDAVGVVNIILGEH